MSQCTLRIDRFALMFCFMGLIICIFTWCVRVRVVVCRLTCVSHLLSKNQCPYLFLLLSLESSKDKSKMTMCHHRRGMKSMSPCLSIKSSSHCIERRHEILLISPLETNKRKKNPHNNSFLVENKYAVVISLTMTYFFF